jgi:hypothetical protein
MKNAYQIFLKLSGKRFSYRDLRKQVSELLAQDTLDIPAEIGLTELLGVAQANHWITKKENGEYEVNMVGAGQAA